MKKPIWESVTPEELAEREAKRKPRKSELASQLEWMWSRSAQKLRGSDRDTPPSLHGKRMR